MVSLPKMAWACVLFAAAGAARPEAHGYAPRAEGTLRSWLPILVPNWSFTFDAGMDAG